MFQHLYIALFCITLWATAHGFKIFKARGVAISYSTRSLTFRHYNGYEDNDKENVKSLESDTKKKYFLKESLLVGASLVVSSHPPLVSAAGTEMSLVYFVRPALDIFVDFMSFLFLIRTVLSWYPKTDITKFPYNVAVWPTEPLLQPVRELVPTQFGVDISAIVWVMLLGLVRELVTGQQGILSLMERSAL